MIVDGVGLNITVVTYKDRVDFGIVGDREQIDDAWAFLEGAAHALRELETVKSSDLSLRSRPRRTRRARPGACVERILNTC